MANTKGARLVCKPLQATPSALQTSLHSSYFVNELTYDLSTAMVKRVQNCYGVKVWPWERAGPTRSK